VLAKQNEILFLIVRSEMSQRVEKTRVSGNVFPERNPEPVRKAMPAPRRIPPILPSAWDQKETGHTFTQRFAIRESLRRSLTLALMLGAFLRQRRVLFIVCVDARAQAPEERHVAPLGLMFESRPWVYKHGASRALSEIFVSEFMRCFMRCDDRRQWLTILRHAAYLFPWKCAS
jgi:hypothetical protein